MPVEILSEMMILELKMEDIFGRVLCPKRICIDIDDVICQYDFPKMVKSFFGIDISSMEIYAYDLADVLGVSSALINTMFREQVHSKPNFIEGAIETLRIWDSKGYELIIHSDREKYMGYMGLAQWLTDHNIPFSGIDSGREKYDVHIDDRPGKLAATDSDLRLLYSQPWNTGCHNITGHLIRVHNWQEIREIIA